MAIDTHPVNADIRRPTLHGRREITGIWFPADWLDESTRAQRILANWQAGATAYRFTKGDLLRFPTGQVMECTSLPGWPLQLYGQTLCSADLTKGEIADLPVADLWLALGGNIETLQLSTAVRLDPSQWLKTNTYTLLDTYDCRASLPKPVLISNEPIRSVRDILEKAPPASPEQIAFLQALRQKAPSAEKPGRSHAVRSDPLGSAPPSMLKLAAIFIAVLVISFVLMNWLGDTSPATTTATATSTHTSNLSTLPFGLLVAIVVAFARLISNSNRNSPASWQSAPHTVRSTPRAQNSSPSIMARRKSFGPQRWRDWLARLAVTSQISKLLGRRQAAYVQRMLALFEQGKLDEALRHAIPLGGNEQSLGQAFGSPSARKDLSLQNQPGAGASINLGDDLNAYLRKLYRNSFEKLDREGRIDEAVFVLAELLQARQEALDYLEKHGRFKQAADLALSWDMPPYSIVRLLCIAGEWRRAIAVARRDNAFGQAVTLLQSKWPDAAKQLRHDWAAYLAAKGEWLQAVEVIWPLPEQHAQAMQWLLSAEAAGGSLAASALVKRALLLPDTVDTYADYLMSLRDDTDLHHERAAIATAILALTTQQATAPITQLARIILPSLLADQARGTGSLPKQDIQRLVSLAKDTLLQADLPNHPLPVPHPIPLKNRGTVLECNIPEVGNTVILDAVPLSDGRYLLAHGESGSTVVDARGKLLFRFSLPANKLILAQSKQYALALASRGDVWRVTRLDLSNRKAEDLGIIQFDHCSQTFDGLSWTIARERQLQVLDLSRSLQHVSWQVNDLPGPIIAMRTSTLYEQLIVEDPHLGPTLWSYQLPQRRLTGRATIADIDKSKQLLLNPDGGTCQIWLVDQQEGGHRLAYRLHNQDREILLPAIDGQFEIHTWLESNWLMIRISTETQILFLLYSRDDAKLRARAIWPAGMQANVSIIGTTWLIYDQQGRLLQLDTANSQQTSTTVQT